MKRLLVGLLASTALAFATAAGAATEQFDGTATLGVASDGFVYEMSGGLVGEWFIPFATFDCMGQPKTYQCTGADTFSGFLDRNGNTVQDAGEPGGTLELVFQLSHAASGNGRCHHVIESGTGDFAGATGQVTFKDRLGACGEVLTTYKGYIKL